MVETVGRNPTHLWGLTVDERVRRIAAAQKVADDGILANAAYAWDPQWLRWIAARPDHVVTRDGVPVLARIVDAAARETVRQAMLADRPLAPEALTVVPQESVDGLVNKELRKRERPFMERLEPGSVRRIERASYFASYKGVTDILTKYLWPEWALVLTRIAARIGVTPNMVTSLGAALCVAATLLFWHGWYWSGIAAGLVFMVLDTVDGKLARCTITSSHWGNIFDHGIDLVHPPFWWWAWGVGLAAYGRPLDGATFAWVMIAIVGGYVVQRVIEGVFMRAFGGIHIHVWQPVDSRFRLITARRNPNMVILVAALALGRPDVGLIAVAWWTILSCLFHAVRLVQAYAARSRGQAVTSWLE